MGTDRESEARAGTGLDVPNEINLALLRLKIDRAATVGSQRSLPQSLSLGRVCMAHPSHVLRRGAVLHRKRCKGDERNDMHVSERADAWARQW